MFDIRDAKAVMGELAEYRRMYEERYIRLCAFELTHIWDSLRISFIVQRPSREPGFMLTRQETDGRNIRYETRAYVVETPEGERYRSVKEFFFEKKKPLAGSGKKLLHLEAGDVTLAVTRVGTRGVCLWE
jgi:hypothetical protein